MVFLNWNLKCCPEFVWRDQVGETMSGHELKMGTSV